MKTILSLSYCVWLGLSLGICGIYYYEWKYWLIVIPTIILVTLFNRERQ
jgi:hypothetical protein